MKSKSILVRNLTEKEVEKLKIMASEKKISLNELCLQILRQNIRELRVDSEATILMNYFKEIAKSNSLLIDSLREDIKLKKETVKAIKKLQKMYASFVEQI